ncbi:unnamed protein product [Nippostrongylus brasiliensis]|uniref:Circumsporozoite protein n=1 Tax=Nippostrongylus brasiliensis TaxID=27835 RepID=A0A0N4XN37_NIPBR|nr:unnamed protein product [Nippostrongylus brasiliensis]
MEYEGIITPREEISVRVVDSAAVVLSPEGTGEVRLDPVPLCGSRLESFTGGALNSVVVSGKVAAGSVVWSKPSSVVLLEVGIPVLDIPSGVPVVAAVSVDSAAPSSVVLPGKGLEALTGLSGDEPAELDAVVGTSAEVGALEAPGPPVVVSSGGEVTSELEGVTLSPTVGVTLGATISPSTVTLEAPEVVAVNSSAELLVVASGPSTSRLKVPVTVTVWVVVRMSTVVFSSESVDPVLLLGSRTASVTLILSVGPVGLEVPPDTVVCSLTLPLGLAEDRQNTSDVTVPEEILSPLVVVVSSGSGLPVVDVSLEAWS